MSEPRAIPRITHQIWFQGWDVIPEKFKKNSEDLARLNPNYTHMKWDETSLRHECGKLGQEVVAKFDSFPYMIQKIDLGRYVILYNYGGITVDTDMAQLKPIDETPNLNTDKLIISQCAFPNNLFTYSYNNALLLAKSHHHVVKDIIDTVVSNKISTDSILYNNKFLYIHYTTGPIIVSQVINKHKNSVIVLNNKYYEPCFGFNPFCSPGKESIMDHQHELSWLHPSMKIFGKLLLILFYLILFLIPIGILYGIILLLQKNHIIPQLFKVVRRRRT
jgi:mannosyltransferase OCH1-like enzyme